MEEEEENDRNYLLLNPNSLPHFILNILHTVVI